MRKLPVIFIAVLLMLSFAACGISKTSVVDISTDNETVNKVSDGNSDQEQNKTEEDTSLKPISVNLNESVSNDFMEVVFNKIYTSYDLLPSDTSGFYSYYEGIEGCKYFILEGTFKNTGTFAEGPYNSMAKVVFDDKYEYPAEIYTEDDNSLGSYNSVNPFKTVRLIISASVPDELLNQYQNVKILWGITECFSYTNDSKYSSVYDWDDVTTIYELKATK